MSEQELREVMERFFQSMNRLCDVTLLALDKMLLALPVKDQ